MRSADDRISARHHVYLSSNRWDDLWIIQQPIANEIARDEPVLFVERFISLFTAIRWPGLWRYLLLWTRGPRRVKDNLWLLAPLPLWHLGHRFPRVFRLEFAIQRLWIRLWASRMPGTNRVLWMDNPLYDCAVGRMGEQLSVYHVGDDVAAFSTSHAPTMERLETRMLGKVDIVFASAEHLAEARRALNPRTFAIANGIDETLFVHESAPETLQALLDIPEPRVALVGMMDIWVDVELVAATARALPHVSIVVVGPWRVSDEPLRGLSNVSLLGPKPRTEIPGILRSCRASLVPFRRMDLTRRIMPVKIFEALAAGVLPIATDFSDEVQRLARRGMVTIARSESEFIAAVRQAVEEPDSRRDARLAEFGLRQTWRARWGEMASILDASTAPLAPDNA